MATTLTPNLKLRIDSNLTANAKYNLSRIDLLGATFLVDSTNTVNLRSQMGIVIEPNSADIGGSGIGGTVSIGTTNHKITSLNIYTTDLNLDGAFNLKDQATTSTGKLGIVYNSTTSGIKDDTARTLTLDVDGANRQLVLAGNLSLLGGNLVLNVSSSSNLNLPTTGTLATLAGAESLTNKTINAEENTLTNIANNQIKELAGIAYSKLNLLDSIKNQDIAANAEISGSKIVPEFTQSVKTTGMLELDNGTNLTKIAPAESGQTASLTFKLPNNYGTANQVLKTDGSGNLSWFSAASGTVTSVSLTTPSDLFTVSPSSITEAGTFTLTKVNQEAHKFYAGPASDGPTEPTFRSIVLTDLPSGIKSYIGLGNVPNEDATNPVNIDWNPDYRTVTDIEKSSWNGKQDALGFTPENAANRGAANGYAPLNASGRIDNSYLDASAMNYHGAWNASTNTPVLADGMMGADPGDVYIVSVPGTRDLGSGSISFTVGDWVIYNQSNVWEKVINSVSVSSVNGATGAVTVQAIYELTGDVTAGPAYSSESKTATIAPGVITDSKISATADIAVSKLAPGTNNQVLTTVAGVPTWAAASGGGGGTTDPTALTNAQATRLGYKKYNSQTAYKDGIIPTITSSFESENPITGATLIPYQMQDGNWRLKGSISTKSLNSFYGNLVSAASNIASAGLNNSLFATAVQSDGKILIGGSFTTLNSTSRTYYARLNSDGTPDTAFNNITSNAVNSTVRAIVVQPDGRILLGGSFTLIRNRLIRLQSSGVVDSSFTNNLGTAFNADVQAIAIQSDGKIIVGGVFTTFNGLTRNRLIRLNSDGTEDTAFYPNLGSGFNNTISSLFIDSDGKILVGGTFTTFNGLTRNRLIRLQSDGTEDTTFYTNLTSSGTGGAFDNTVLSIVINSSLQKIYVGGVWSNFNGIPKGKLLRLNSDGTPDTAFNNLISSITNGDVVSLGITSNNSLIVGGTFTGYSSSYRGGIFKLNSDGTEDSAYYTNMVGTGIGLATTVVSSVAVQSDNKVILGGGFTSLSGSARTRLVRLFSNGKEDGPPQQMSYTINGITFDSSNSQTVFGKVTLGSTTVNSNIIDLYSIPLQSAAASSLANIGIFNGGCTFDVDLSSEPTWAYAVDVPAPEIVAVNTAEVSSAQYAAEVDYVSTVLLSSITIHKYNGGVWDYYDSPAVGVSPSFLGIFSRPSSGSPDDLYRVTIINEGGSDEQEFNIPAQTAILAPQITFAGALSINGYEALLQADYINTATTYSIEQDQGGVWVTYQNGSITEGSPFYFPIMRALPPTPSTNYRVFLGNAGGTSSPSVFSVFGQTGTPSSVGMLIEGLPGTPNFNIQISYSAGSNPVSQYTVEQYIGTGNPFQDYNPSNWIYFDQASILSGSPVTTSTYTRPATSTTYRVRVGNMGVVDSYSNWNFITVGP